MTDADRPREPKVEVMPPAQQERGSSLAQMLQMNDVPLRVVLWKRMELWGAERVMRGLEAVLRAEQCAYDAGVFRNQAKLEFEKSKIPLEKLDDILDAERERVEAEIEGMKIKAKLDVVNMKSQLAEAEFEAKYQEAERDIRKLRLDLQRDDLTKKPETKSGPARSKAEQTFDDFMERADALDLVPRFIKHMCEKEGVESEEDLSDDATQMIIQLREGIIIGQDDEY